MTTDDTADVIAMAMNRYGPIAPSVARALREMGFTVALAAGVPAAPEGIDRERLARALFEAERPGDWPTWDDYVGAFGSPGIAPWRRKADRIADEYEVLA